MGLNYPPDLKDRIARVLSEILSDKYDAKITLRFVPKDGAEEMEDVKGASIVTADVL